MTDPTPTTIPLPLEAFRAFQALIELEASRLKQLAELQCSQPLDLAFARLFSSLAERLETDPRTIQIACMQALIPLNGLRRRLEMTPTVFLDALNRTVTERAPEEWRNRHLEAWKAVAGELPPFFQSDNFFSQASKAFDLLSERPAILHNARILTELRPIYDEGKTTTLALLQTNTLVLDYWDGSSIRTLHVSLDNDDLRSFEEELRWARQKISISQKEAYAEGRNIVMYGDVDENGPTE